jgi:protein-tyrosine phosphatase
MKMKSIIFVCLGNICRSPIAQGCAMKLAQEKSLNIKVDSSGTSSWHVGEAPCANSIKVCHANGVDISIFRASQFTIKDIEEYNLIVALDDSNFRDLKALGATNIVKLGDYGYNSQDVPDPYFFGGYDGFDKVFTMIDECVKNLFEKEFKNKM